MVPADLLGHFLQLGQWVPFGLVSLVVLLIPLILVDQ
jgi:hypothetical protein